jgi:uncharacterized protein YlxP (DUF503 family)
MYVVAVEMQLRLPHAHSLKDKRQVVKSLVETSRRRFGVSAAEVGHQESWQRAAIGFAVVASSAGQAEAVLDDIDRFVWSRSELEVLDAERRWLG